MCDFNSLQQKHDNQQPPEAMPFIGDVEVHGIWLENVSFEFDGTDYYWDTDTDNILAEHGFTEEDLIYALEDLRHG